MADLYNCCPLKSGMYYSNVADRPFDGLENLTPLTRPKLRLRRCAWIKRRKG